MRTYQELCATVQAAGFPPLNEDHIRYSLDMGTVRWEVRFHCNTLKIKKRFHSLQMAKIFRDAIIANGLIVPDQPIFLDHHPKNRNLVKRDYKSRQYTGQDIILGPPTVVYWN